MVNFKKSVRFFSFLPVIFVFIFLITNFDQFFIEFHHILFRNSNWIFDPAKDPIINVLPEEFFQIEFIIFFVLLMLILFLINLLISRQIKKELLLNNSMNIPVASKWKIFNCTINGNWDLAKTIGEDFLFIGINGSIPNCKNSLSIRLHFWVNNN